jgi:hypothetical protein
VFLPDTDVAAQLLLNRSFDAVFTSTSRYQSTCLEEPSPNPFLHDAAVDWIAKGTFRRNDFTVLHELYHVDSQRKAYPYTTSTELFPSKTFA